MAGTNKYNVVIRATLNKTDLYKQIDEVSKNLKPINLDVNVGSKSGTTANASKEVDALTAAHVKLAPKVKETAKAHDDLGQSLTKAVYKMALWKIAGDMLFGTLQKLGEVRQYIADLNSELVKMQYVTGATEIEAYKMADAYNGLAASMRVSTLEVAKGSLEWIRQGKTASEALALTRESIYLSKMGNLEAAQATELLTSTLNGFKMEAYEAGTVVDKLLVIDNKYSTSAGELALALQRSANTAQVAGLSFDRLTAYIGIVSSVTRKSAESIGNSMKTILTRLTDVKLGKKFDEAGESISDVEKTLKKFGIEVRDENLQFKDAGVIIDEVARKWETLGNVQKAAVAKAMGGTWQRENFLTLMENYDMLDQMLKLEGESIGLRKENIKAYLDSVEGQQERMKTSWDAIWTSSGWATFLKGWFKFWGDFNVIAGRGLGAVTGDEGDLKDFENRIKKQKELIASMKAMPNETRDENYIANLTDALSVLEDEYDKLAIKLGKATDPQEIFNTSLKVAKDDVEDMADALGTAANDTAYAIEQIAQANDLAATEALNSATAIQSNESSLRSLIDGYNAATGATMEQISIVQQLLGAEWQEAVTIDQNTGLVYINMEAVRQLTLAKAEHTIKELEDAIAIDQNNSMLINALSLTQAHLGQIKQTAYWLPKVSSGTKQVSDNEKAYQDLLKMTIDMLKDKANAEKDALKDELNGYKDIIDARKEILDQMKDEKDYQDELSEKNKELTDIDNELLELQFDNSEEAKSKRLLLEEEKAKKLKEIEDAQFDNSIDEQKNALDQEYDNYKEYIDAKIKELDNYLSESGTLTQEAIQLLADKSSTFYQELIEWNRRFGTGVDTDVTGKWTTAFNTIVTYSGGAAGAIGGVTNAVEKLGDALDNLTWQEIPEGYGLPSDWMNNTSPTTSTSKWDWQAEHPESFDSGGIVGGLPKLKSGQKFAQVMDGEAMTTPSQIEQFINSTLPNLVAVAGNGGGTTINMAVNVAGSLDKTVLPQLKSTILDTINKAMKSRGMKRTAGSFSL